MDTVEWNGITLAKTLFDDEVEARNALADAAKRHDWNRVIDLVPSHTNRINTSRLGGTSLYAPLHQAAHGGAPREIAQELIDLGASRTLRTSSGERSVDIARRLRHVDLEDVLTPQLKHSVPVGILEEIQVHFHAVIRGRAQEFVEEHALRLPELEPLLELDKAEMWFPIPGMYGGFSYRLECAGVDSRLVADSWCRVVGGSGQRHEITARGSQLTDEGFV